MIKLFLSLFIDNFNKKPTISLTEERPQESERNTFFRSSPIYQIDSANSFIDLPNIFSGQIFFLFSSKPVNLLDSIKKNNYLNQIDFKIYITQGFASLVLFLSENSKDFKSELNNLNFLIAYELWEINEDVVIKDENNIPNFNRVPYISVALNSLEHEEKTIFSDIISSLNLAYAFSNKYLNLYIPVLNEIKRKVLDFYYRSLYLNAKYMTKISNSF